MLGRFLQFDEGASRAASRLVLVGSLLALYVMFGKFNDPLPEPAREIACVLVLAMLLARIAWRWTRRLASGGAAASPVRLVFLTFLDLVLAYIFFRTTFFDPLPKPLGLILSLSVFPLLLAMTMWTVATSKDEVQRASAHESFSWGALVGLCLIFAGLFTVRFWPAMSDWLQSAASGATNGLSPAAIGFANGTLYSLLVVWISLMVSWGLWWRSKR